MKFKEIKKAIEGYDEQGLNVFTTSSFQSHSLVLLHMLSRINPDIAVAFINTGFHFPETIDFRDEVVERFGLTNLLDVKSGTPKSMQKGNNGRLLFASDPDYCCFLNKTLPLETVLRSHDIWVNGVRADQSAARRAMSIEQKAPHGTTRFHPMLDWSNKDILAYRKEFDLPTHPLEAKGYLSIGCEPCTRKFDLDMQEREARWFGLNKTECGLHTDLIETK